MTTSNDLMSAMSPNSSASSTLNFTQLNLAQPLLRALREEGYETPTPVQARAIPPVMEGRDVLGCAQTGTGKTAAFALPLLHRLLEAPVDKTRRGPAFPRVLVLSPTRELATQIGDSFGTYGRHTGLYHTCIFGGVSQYHQVKALHRGVDILVATPGRLIDLMEQRLVNLTNVQVFVLDEADRMLDMGFINPIRKIAAALPTQRQTLLFSATMPKEIMHLADSLLKNPVKVAVTPVASAAPLIEQKVYMVGRRYKQSLLEHALTNNDFVGEVERAVVFTRTKHGADKVTRRLEKAGIPATAIHGNKAQNQRQRALDAFRTGRCRVLVATDVAARGLDIDGITHVFNFDLPVEPEAYVHRIGRTGRAGATGIAIAFCDDEERPLLRDIEKLTGRKINAIRELPPLPEPPPRAEFGAEGETSDRDDRGMDRGHTHRPSHPHNSNAPRRGPRQKPGNGDRNRGGKPAAADGRASKPGKAGKPGAGAGPRNKSSSSTTAGPKRGFMSRGKSKPRRAG